MPPTFIHTSIVSTAFILISSLTGQAALIPALPQQISINGQTSPLSLLSGPSPSPTTAIEDLANPAAGLNPLSLVSPSSLLPTSNPDSALQNIFNGIKVAFPSSSSPVNLASLTSNANQILPTASGLPQGAVPSITSLLPSTSSSSLSFLTGASISTDGVIQSLPASCVEVFNVNPLPLGVKPSTLITLQPACSPLSVFVDTVNTETGSTFTSPVLGLTNEGATNLVSQTGIAAPISALPSILSQNVASTPINLVSTPPISPHSGLALVGVPTAGSTPSSNLPLALGSPSIDLAPSLPQATGSTSLIALVPAPVSYPSLPCTSISTSGAACSLLPGSVQPVNGNRPCGTCPINAGLQGVVACPWLCSISFIGAGVYSCSQTDITGQSFPDSSNNSNHLAEAVCHQCAAPCTTSLASTPTPVNTMIPSSPTIVAVQATSNTPSCTNLPSSADPPCCEPYGSRGNLVCSACPVDPTVLVACPWLCRMPYVQGRVDLECSPIDLTRINLFSPYNETVQCKRCRPGCSPYSAIPTTTCALSTTVSNPLIPTSLSALLPATAVSSTVPTCTNSAPDSPLVTCTGGPEFSTLFCPHGCPTIFTGQCAFLCTSNFGNDIGGLFPAIQCATVDLSLISPGTLSCQQCYPQCNNGSAPIASPNLLSGGSNNTLTTGPTVNVSATSNVVSNNTTLPRVTLSATPNAASSPTCAIVTPGAVDTPASQDTATGLLFRSTCGISAATVAQCPFLCSQGGGAFFQECSQTDISGQQPIGQFPPIECTHCLPPCGNASVSPFLRPSSGFVQSTTPAGSSGIGNSSSSAFVPTASMTAPLPSLSASALALISYASSNQSTLRSVLVATGSISLSAISSVASGQPNQSTLVEALTSLTSLASTTSTPGSVLSSSNSASASSVSASSNATNSGSVTISSAPSNSANLNSGTKVSSSSTSVNSASVSSSSTNSASASSTSASSTSASSTLSSVASISSTIGSSTSPTCTTIVPSGIDTPAIVEPNTGLVVRSSCGFTAETVAQCPFICSAGGGAPNGNCSTEDMTGKLMYGSYPPLVCHQCLPPCKGATTASTGPTCSSVAPNSPDPSALIDLSGLLHRDLCGTSASTVADCPYLCGLKDQGKVSRQCFFQDLTNKIISGQAADVGLLVCEKCLPPCGNSALPSCSSNILSAVNSLAGALPATIPSLVGSIQIQPFVGAIPTSLPAVSGLINTQLIKGAIPSNIPAILGATPATIPSLVGSIEADSIISVVSIAVPTIAVGNPNIVSAVVKSNEAQSIVGALAATASALASSIEAQSVVNAIPTTIPSILGGVLNPIPAFASVEPTTIQAVAGSETPIPASLAAHPVLGSLIAALPIKATPAAALPTSGLVVASLPITVVPSSPIVPLKPGNVFPPVMAERDIANAFQRRDVVDTIVEGSPAAQLQLTCGDTSESVAACPFLCSPMNGGIQGFRRCAAVDLTNNFIGVDRVTCEKCLPLCLD